MTKVKLIKTYEDEDGVYSMIPDDISKILTIDEPVFEFLVEDDKFVRQYETLSHVYIAAFKNNICVTIFVYLKNFTSGKTKNKEN